MKLSFLTRICIILLVAGLSLACALGGLAPTATPAPTLPPSPTATALPPSPTPVPSTAAPAVVAPPAFAAPPQVDCQQIQNLAAGALKVSFSLETASFSTPSGHTGQGCVMQAKGTAVNFKDVPSVMNTLLQAFPGWVQDANQAADSPTGSIQGIWSGNKLLLIQAGWQPAPEANCPTDQPIASCNLTPEQQIYTITLTAGTSLLAPAAAAVAPTAAPTTAALPTQASHFNKDQVIGFPAGSMQATISGSVNYGNHDRYRFSLVAGESVNIQLSSTQQTAGFALLGPDQKPMKGSENYQARWYSAGFLDGGEYAVVVTSELGRADYELVVTIGQLKGTPTSSVGSYAPLPANRCKQLRSQARNAVGAVFSMGEGSFSAATGERGIACVLSASIDKDNFTSAEDVMSALVGAFPGWSSDSNLAADGTNSSVRGLRDDDDLLLISVQLQSSSDAYIIVIQAATR